MRVIWGGRKGDCIPYGFHTTIQGDRGGFFRASNGWTVNFTPSSIGNDMTTQSGGKSITIRFIPGKRGLFRSGCFPQSVEPIKVLLEEWSGSKSGKILSLEDEYFKTHPLKKRTK